MSVNKNKDEKNENKTGELTGDEPVFMKVTPEIIYEKVSEHKQFGFAPIIVELSPGGREIELFVSINSMHSGGTAWINGFTTDGEFIRINENVIATIIYPETTQAHYDEFNRYVDQAIIFHKQNKEFEDQFGLFKEPKKDKYPYDQDVV